MDVAQDDDGFMNVFKTDLVKEDHVAKSISKSEMVAPKEED